MTRLWCKIIPKTNSGGKDGVSGESTALINIVGDGTGTQEESELR